MTPIALRMTGRDGRTLVAAHLIGLLIVSAGAFGARNDMLLTGNDGEFTRNTVIQLFRFAEPGPWLPMATFEGMGTLFQFNPFLSPSLLPLGLFNETLAVTLGYLICAGLMFISTYALGRAFNMSRFVSLLAAWALPLLCLPYQPWLVTYSVYAVNTLGGDTVSFAMLGLALLVHCYTSRQFYWAAFGFAVVVAWLFLANPTWIMLLLPTVIPVGIGIIISRAGSRAGRPDFLARGAWTILPSTIFIVVGGGPYLFGLYSDTAAAFFFNELNTGTGMAWSLVSVATTAGRGIHPVGGPWVAFAVTGVVLAILREAGPLRTIAISVLTAIFLCAIYSAVYMMSPIWALPYPIYFEFFLWPLYTLFAAYAAVKLGKGAAGLFHVSDAPVAERFSRFISEPLRHFVLLAGVSVALCIGLLLHPFTITPNTLYGRPDNTVVTKALRSAAAIAPNEAFRGYIATLTGFGGPNGAPTNWFSLLNENNAAFLKFGNPDRMPYLWRFDLATLEAYSQAVEPAFYSVATRLLARPGDGQVRNIIAITRADIPLMQSLGVRFLITDYPIPAPARLTTQLVEPPLSHFVFELPDPNDGSYSPTNIVVAADATDVLRRIADPDFDFRKTLVLDEQLDQALQPAQSTRATLVRGGWRIQAQSKAVSLLLLPLQFSSCLSVTERPGPKGKVVAIRRANLASTALVFEGAVDVELSLRVSPFWGAYCRLRDARSMKEFGLTNLPAKVPAMTH